MTIRFSLPALLSGITFIYSTLPAMTQESSSQSLKLAIISDVHLFAPSLLKEDGEAFRAYIAKDRKLLCESPALLKEALDLILNSDSEVLLISGDLTKDGELASHLFLRDNYLAPLREKGFRIFVIPGNHDINNPHAVEFEGNKSTRVATINAQQFAEIYANYGYSDALARDANSLSYVARLAPGLRILCLDSCRYEDNSFEENECVTAGRLKRGTIKFIKAQAKAARKAGDKLIAMMHHGAIRHWKWQGILLDEYLVKNWRRISRILSRNGVSVVFTGHFHANDIVKKGGITDVETGSLVSYPAPLRFATIEGGKMSIRTEFLKGEGLSFPSGNTLQEEMLEYANQAISGLAKIILPRKVSEQTLEKCCEVLSKSYAAHLKGDEQASKQELAELKSVVKLLRKETFIYAFLLNKIAKGLWTELSLSDSNAEIILR